jgi:hypothetical protein
MENEADFFPSSELALERALVNNAMFPVLTSDNINGLIVAAPANLTAPSSVILAATLFTIVPDIVQGIKTSFSLGYHTSGAGDLTVLFRAVPNATAFAGGDNSQSRWRFENGGTPVTVTGDAAVTVATLVQTNAGAGSNVLTWSAPGFVGQGTSGFEIVVSCGQNLSAMTLSALVEVIGQ